MLIPEKLAIVILILISLALIIFFVYPKLTQAGASAGDTASQFKLSLSEKEVKDLGKSISVTGLAIGDFDKEIEGNELYYLKDKGLQEAEIYKCINGDFNQCAGTGYTDIAYNVRNVDIKVGDFDNNGEDELYYLTKETRKYEDGKDYTACIIYKCKESDFSDCKEVNKYKNDKGALNCPSIAVGDADADGKEEFYYLRIKESGEPCEIHKCERSDFRDCNQYVTKNSKTSFYYKEGLKIEYKCDAFNGGLKMAIGDVDEIPGNEFYTLQYECRHNDKKKKGFDVFIYPGGVPDEAGEKIFKYPCSAKYKTYTPASIEIGDFDNDGYDEFYYIKCEAVGSKQDCGIYQYGVGVEAATRRIEELLD